jgi:hypothetical protein
LHSLVEAMVEQGVLPPHLLCVHRHPRADRLGNVLSYPLGRSGRPFLDAGLDDVENGDTGVLDDADTVGHLDADGGSGGRGGILVCAGERGDRDGFVPILRFGPVDEDAGVVHVGTDEVGDVKDRVVGNLLTFLELASDDGAAEEARVERGVLRRQERL